MPAYLVFNELSTAVAAPESRTGRIFLDGLSEVILDQRISQHRTLVVPVGFNKILVSAGYSIGRWLAEIASIEKRQRIRLLLDRSIQYRTCISNAELDATDIEYRCRNRITEGLATALLADGLAVSLLTDDEWNHAFVNLEKCWIGADDIEVEIHSVPHASQVEHLTQHADWLRRTQISPPANGAQLWRQRNQLFPSIDFCDCVETQILSLNGTERRFKAALRGLQDLQNYCACWTTGYFNIKALVRASGESESTLQVYSDERTFFCPDGNFRVFQWHLKRDDTTRIYFFDFPEQKRLLVGYIGPHLRITSE